MGARNSKKETPPHPPSSEWAKKASLYKHTGTPGKDGGQRKEKKKNKMNWADLHQEKFVDGIIAFSKLTTCHGPGHVVRNRGTCFGVMWAVITIVLYICLMVIQGDLLVRFSKREVQSQV
ncbi:hypothetical protein O3P69_008422 [Scylla paramamosain]|uniref:Uncharacterized protein n=1 Tax=Scylla paramamosain TaxID=85552 RepID=A0AAW0SK99_SCYPA